MLPIYLTEQDTDTSLDRTTPEGFTLQQVGSKVVLTGCNNATELTKLIIPKGVHEIGSKAFTNCKSLSEVTIAPNSDLLAIGDYAFYNLPNLRSVNCSNSSLQRIGDSAFSLCSTLSKVQLNDGLSDIGRNAFYSCFNLPNIDIPESVVVLEDGAFAQCRDLQTVTLGGQEFNTDNMYEVGKNIFRYDDNLPSELQHLNYDSQAYRGMTQEQQRINDEIDHVTQQLSNNTTEDPDEFEDDATAYSTTVDELNQDMTDEYVDTLSEFISDYINSINLNTPKVQALSSSELYNTMCQQTYDYITGNVAEQQLLKLVKNLFQQYRTLILNTLCRKEHVDVNSTSATKLYKSYCASTIPLFVQGIQSLPKEDFISIFIDNDEQLNYTKLVDLSPNMSTN